MLSAVSREPLLSSLADRHSQDPLRYREEVIHSNLPNEPIRLAIIKYGGMSAGGTEKFLQNVAAYVDKTRFEVTFFYCDSSRYVGTSWEHPGTEPSRVKWLQARGVKLVEFQVGAKDVSKRTHPWVDTDFWDVFDETEYDLVQTGRAGNREYPFTQIRKVPIIDSIHLNAGVHDQENILRVMCLSEWSKSQWIRRGGNPKKAVRVSHPIPDDLWPADETRLPQLGEVTVFGFHQRVSDDIFSPVPLLAYSKIENSSTAFRILGGGDRYKQQAKDLSLRNVEFVSHTPHPEDVASFLAELNVYAHGRADGEINSTAIAEALRSGLPLVTHASAMNQGHREVAERCGFFAESLKEYVSALDYLLSPEARSSYGSKSRNYYLANYELTTQVQRIEMIYLDALYGERPRYSHVSALRRQAKGAGNRAWDRVLRKSRMRSFTRAFTE